MALTSLKKVTVVTCTCADYVHMYRYTVPVIKKYRTEAVPKQYRSSTELTPNVERTSTVMYTCICTRCGAVRCARYGARGTVRAMHARAIALAGAVLYGTDF